MAEVPAQQRLRDELLGWHRRRPDDDPAALARLRAWFERELAALGSQLDDAVATMPRGRLTVTKSKLSWLACDGLALEPEPFVHTWASTRGILTHAVIERDWGEGRQRDETAVVADTWQAEASKSPGDPRSTSAWMNQRSADEQHELREQLAGLLAAFRAVWPRLDDQPVDAALERRCEIALAAGRVVLFGRPDLVISSPVVDGQARTLVIDLKTGRPQPEQDRVEARFYALLVALTQARLPFRWGTYYVPEGRYDVEDLHLEALTAVARQVLAVVKQQVSIAGRHVDDVQGLTLRAGAWCRRCARRSRCPLAPEEFRWCVTGSADTQDHGQD